MYLISTGKGSHSQSSKHLARLHRYLDCVLSTDQGEHTDHIEDLPFKTLGRQYGLLPFCDPFWGMSLHYCTFQETPMFPVFHGVTLSIHTHYPLDKHAQCYQNRQYVSNYLFCISAYLLLFVCVAITIERASLSGVCQVTMTDQFLSMETATFTHSP